MFFYKNVSISKKIEIENRPNNNNINNFDCSMVWASPQTKITHLRRESSLLRLFFLNKNLGHPEFLLGGSGQF